MKKNILFIILSLLFIILLVYCNDYNKIFSKPVSAKPILECPINEIKTIENCNNDLLTFKWQKEVNSMSYLFQLSNNSDFTDILINKETSETSIMVNLKNMYYYKKYFWRIIPIDWTGIYYYNFVSDSSYVQLSPKFDITYNTLPLKPCDKITISASKCLKYPNTKIKYNINMTNYKIDVLQPDFPIEITIPDSGRYKINITASFENETFSSEPIELSVKPMIPNYLKVNDNDIIYYNALFRWKSEIACHPINEENYYQLQISTSSLFEENSILYNINRIDDNYLQMTENELDLIKLKQGNTYYWRVRQLSINNNETFFSDWKQASFYIAYFNDIEIISPDIGARFNLSSPEASNIELSWKTVEGVSNYELMLSNNSDFQNPEVFTINDSTKFIVDKSYIGTNYWSVRPVSSPLHPNTIWSHLLSDKKAVYHIVLDKPDFIYPFEHTEIVWAVNFEYYIRFDLEIDVEIKEPRTDYIYSSMIIKIETSKDENFSNIEFTNSKVASKNCMPIMFTETGKYFVRISLDIDGRLAESDWKIFTVNVYNPEINFMDGWNLRSPEDGCPNGWDISPYPGFTSVSDYSKVWKHIDNFLHINQVKSYSTTFGCSPNLFGGTDCENYHLNTKINTNKFRNFVLHALYGSFEFLSCLTATRNVSISFRADENGNYPFIMFSVDTVNGIPANMTRLLYNKTGINTLVYEYQQDGEKNFRESNDIDSIMLHFIEIRVFDTVNETNPSETDTHIRIILFRNKSARIILNKEIVINNTNNIPEGYFFLSGNAESVYDKLTIINLDNI